ncbi:hypothetical protein MMC12_004698 [Toensbergia leucococca]|nr:hypothetical protein [Toensbergia leucococca]
MDAAKDREYSTLEVTPHDGKQVSVAVGTEHIVDDGGIEVVAKEDSYAHEFGYHRVQAHPPSRKKWILFGGTVGLVLTLAAVLGIVFGLRHKRPATTSLTSPSNSSAISSLAISPRRNIAAISFASNNTRVYFQDDMGQIMEAANSADDPTWNIKRIGVGGKNGSAIAAAVSQPDFPLVISVFYLDISNVIHNIAYTAATGRWNSGALSGQGYTAMSNSSLAAMHNQCTRCANTTIIAFQDENGLVQIGNLTSTGWTLTQLGSALDPEMGTGLALQPFYRNGSEDQINLFHQKSNLNMSLASWKPAPYNNGVAGWSLNEQTYRPIPPGSPIAAAASYSNVSTGFETWIEVLSVSDKGVEVDTWSGAINDWLEQYDHPLAMANSTTGNNGGKVYGSVAVTASGSAFGVVRQEGRGDGIENWQVGNEMVDWSAVGDVDLEGAWS